MSSLTIYIHKSIEENASLYFEKAKQMKRKIQGAKDALEKTRKQLEKLQKEAVEEKKVTKKAAIKREWYEKFRWFFTSEGFLVIMGRDATTNEIIIKKHTNPDDLVLHTDMAGSPFAVIKSEGKKIGPASIEETAQATASYSRAWKLGLSTLDVFYVNPEQVTKKARPGEYLQKGAFMIYGKTNYLHPTLKLAVGIDENGRLVGGPDMAIKAHAKDFAIIMQGTENPSDVAKKLHHRFKADIDEILRFLPSGGCRIER
ncbi:MAG TPA: NFACT RNA binding domain-containing protein [Candidatus Nanoarchaeia archaeon]|nr:NFACT RNA binding domain-containing protein [Candidatus Nanoarchaeia archaeon]